MTQLPACPECGMPTKITPLGLTCDNGHGRLIKTSEMKTLWTSMGDEPGEEWRSCPTHPEQQCAVIFFDTEQKQFTVKAHGFVIPGLVSADLQELQDAVDKLFANMSFPKAKAPPVDPSLLDFSKNPPIKAFAYNMFQVMHQGTQFGKYVLVYSPRFGPLDPNQAINLACWLRRFAEEAGNVAVGFDDMWREVSSQ